MIKTLKKRKELLLLLSLTTLSFILQEALKYFNQTTKQKEMLEFALNYLQIDDEVRFKQMLNLCQCCYNVSIEHSLW